MLPVRSSTMTARSTSIPKRSQAAWMMRTFAWWGTTRVTSSAVMPAWFIDLVAESTMMRTARRKTSLPSMWMKPPTSAHSRRPNEPSASRSHASSWPGPSTASSTTAPEPSPNSTAVLRSSQSTMRDSESVPISSTLRAPMAIIPWAVMSPYTNPEHAALTSNAPQRRPSSFWTVAAVPHWVSGVVVAKTSASMSARSTPDMSSAARPDSVERPTVVPPTWRSRMPVRSTIQSSDVAIICSRSLLVSVLGPRAVPQPVITAPRTPEGSAGISDRPQPCDGLSHCDSFSVDGNVTLQHTGER